jgi:hypothetical protein
LTELAVFHGLLIGWFVLAAVVFVVLFFIAAPYGRHTRRGWGFAIDSRWGWVLMEAPAPVVLAVCFVFGSHINVVAAVFLVLWEAHYLHRAFIYPFGRRDSARDMPVLLICFGFVFNVMNGYLNGRYLFTFSGGYQTGWLTDPCSSSVTSSIGGPIMFYAVCGRPVNPIIRYRIVVFIAGSPVPIISAKLLSGPAGRWQPGRCRL